jgi:PAS domain S-box-containing protein
VAALPSVIEPLGPAMSPGLIALLAGPAILVPLAAYAIARRRVRGAGWYAVLLLSIAFWSLAYAWELSAQLHATKLLALRIKYLAVVLMPTGWIGFILAFVGSPAEHVRRRVLPVAAVSAIMLALAWTDGWHGLFWGRLTVEQIGAYAILRGRGPFFWVNVLYTYAVLAAGIVLLASHAMHSPYLYKNRARLLMVGTVVPWAGNVVFVMSRHETIIDPTPFLFTCTAVIAALAVFRYELFEPVPTLRDARIESVGDGVIILDRRSRMADLNPAAERILGRRRAEVAGASIAGLLPGWPSDAVPASPTDITLGSGPTAGIYDVRCTQMCSRAGEVTGAIVLLRDVTERRLAERALGESERRYRTVIDQAFDGVWLESEGSTIVDVNPGACAMLGYSRDELIGRRATELVEPESSAPQHPNPDHVRSSDTSEWQRRIIGKHGRSVLLAGRSRQIAPGLVVSTFRDITRERAEAEERERLLQQAQTANRLKDEFLATLSHELRTPLTAVLGWTRMLVRGEVKPDRVTHALGVIERNAMAQARLVDDLLDVSRITGGRLRLRLVETDVTNVIRDALEAIRPSAEAKRIFLEVHFPAAIPRIIVDPERLQQVIWNLLTNAIKFTPAAGTVHVGASTVPDGVEITVRDTGRGIPGDFLPFVFDAFRQGEGGSNRTAPGLGLGLAIVQRIIEAHGGRVAAASEGAGLGSTFRVFLPAVSTGSASGTDASRPAAREARFPF